MPVVGAGGEVPALPMGIGGVVAPFLPVGAAVVVLVAAGGVELSWNSTDSAVSISIRPRCTLSIC